MDPGKVVRTGSVPAWAVLLILAVPALGIASLLGGNTVRGVIFLAAVPAAAAVGLLIRLLTSRQETPAEPDGPVAVARTMVRWGAGLGIGGLLFVLIGVRAIVAGAGAPFGVAAVLVGLFGVLLAGRAVVVVRAVRQLAGICARHEIGSPVVLVAKELGLDGFTRRPVVIGMDETRLVVMRAGILHTASQIMSIADVSHDEVNLKGAGGDLELVGEGVDLKLDGIPASPLVRAQAIFGASPRT